MAHRDRRRQGRAVQQVARLEDRGPCLDGLALDAHVGTQLRGDANLDCRGCLSNAGRVVRVLDLDDRVRAFGERGARHNAHRLAGLQVVFARVARRNVRHDRQRPRPLTLQVSPTQRKTVHRRVRKGRQRDPRAQVHGQAPPQALLGGHHVVRENMAERERLNQVSVLHRGQRRIMHDTSVGARRVCGCLRGSQCRQGGQAPMLRGGALREACAVATGGSWREIYRGEAVAGGCGWVCGGNCDHRAVTRRRHAVVGCLW